MTVRYRCPHCGREVDDARVVNRSDLPGPFLRLWDWWWRRERALDACRERGHLNDLEER